MKEKPRPATLGLQTREGPSKELSLLTVPSICEPMASPPIQFCIDTYDYLNGLDLADSPSNSSHTQPDILIGLDHLLEIRHWRNTSSRGWSCSSPHKARLGSVWACAITRGSLPLNKPSYSCATSGWVQAVVKRFESWRVN